MREPKHCPLLSLRSRSIVSVNNHYEKLWTSLIKNKWKLLQNKLWANFSTANLNRISVRHYVLLKSFDCCNRENLLFVSQFILVEYRMAFILFCCGFQRSQRTPFFAQLEGNHVARLQKHRSCSANWSMVSIQRPTEEKKAVFVYVYFVCLTLFHLLKETQDRAPWRGKCFPVLLFVVFADSLAMFLLRINRSWFFSKLDWLEHGTTVLLFSCTRSKALKKCF